MNRFTTKRFIGTALVTGLIGFSSVGLAQSHAIDEYRADNSTSAPSQAATQQAHPIANAISNDLTAYEQRSRDNAIGAPRDGVSAQEHAVPARIVNLRSDLDAYYGENSFQNKPASDIPVARQETARQLSENLARFEESGGTLSAVNF